MFRTLFILCAILPASILALMPGCTAAYDPSTPATYSLESRADLEGKSTEPRTRERKGLFRKTPIVTPASTPSRFATPRPVVRIPDTRAGKQLTWLLTQLSGGSSRAMDLHYSKEFTAKTPIWEARATIVQWRRDEFGDAAPEVFRVEESTQDRIIVTARGRTTDKYSRLTVSTNSSGLITALSLTPLPNFKSEELGAWDRIDQKLAGLSGRTSIACFELTPKGLEQVHSLDPEQRMSIGAVSSLSIAGALAEQIKAGTIGWKDELEVVEIFKSLVGGRLQLEAPEVTYPISRFLELMLSESDNTAFDHLLARTGRDKVEAYQSRLCKSPVRPFLATMEYFRIKLGRDRALPKQFAAADENARRALLAENGPVDKSAPSLAAYGNWRTPFEVERIGWYSSAADCCRILADLHAKESTPGMEPLYKSLRMSPGLAPDPAAWKSIAFKSGSEPGVLAMTWLLERNDGRWFTLAIIANDTTRAVNQDELNSVAAASIRLLAEMN